MITLTINDRPVEARGDQTIIQAANGAGIYIPSLCYHPDLPPGGTAVPLDEVWQGPVRHEQAGDREGRGCGLCVVEVRGQAELSPACSTPVREGMSVCTESDRIKKARQERLALILSDHPHACLTCAQNQGCPRTQCSSNVPENERCCPQLGHCEIQTVAEYVGLPGTARRWIPTDLPVLDGPLFIRDYNLCLGCTRCVRVCRDLRGVNALGFVRTAEGRTVVGTVAGTLEDSGCRFCTACVEVCPTGALRDKKKIIRPDRDLVPCVSACPAGLDIPSYLRSIAQGRLDEAQTIIREKIPFPGVLGRICVRPCEQVCRRGEINEPVAICDLKRFAADHRKESWRPVRPPKEDSGHKVAVVGAGPSGLTCALYLSQAGHRVTVFEAAAEPGGMLGLAIPEFRLPAKVLHREIREVLESGVDLKTNRVYGRDFTCQTLAGQGYEAVYLALGAQAARKIPLAGANREGVLWGLDFLRSARQEFPPELSGPVVVIGGGNVAIDAALTARRLGAAPVHLACLEKPHEMPAHAWECAGAVTEGVIFHHAWGPLEVFSSAGRVTGLKLVRCTAVLDDHGVFNPVFNRGETRELPADRIILAVGQAVETTALEAEQGLALERGLVAVTPDQATSLPGVWAGGDLTRMPGSVVEAVAAGRRAAAAIDRALGGRGQLQETPIVRRPAGARLGREEGFAAKRRQKFPCLPWDRRNRFGETELGYEPEQALAEAARCLQCDLRLDLRAPLAPPEPLQPFTAENLARVPEKEGVFILYDEQKKTLSIQGSMDLHRSLQEKLAENTTAAFFDFEADPMYTRRESELLQHYLQEHGELPGGGDDELDDLF